MNLELLKKLVKLANNNPNEHEANLAARRACKLIEDEKFEFREKTEGVRSNDIRSYGTPYSNSSFWDDIMNTKRGTNQYSYTKAPREEVKFDPFAFRHPFWERSDTDSNVKRKIKCYKCGEVKETRFRGLADNWICMECRGKEYQNK